MYVAVKGGEAAIDNAHTQLADERRGDRSLPEISTAQIGEQLSFAVDRVMNEGSLYDRELASLAVRAFGAQRYLSLVMTLRDECLSVQSQLSRDIHYWAHVFCSFVVPT